LNAETLAQVLRPIKETFQDTVSPDLLTGLNEPDDAAVWRLDDQRALVVTTDFFTPVVDDAYDYGAIAAANSLSDVYAMGGEPFLALNVAAIPPQLPTEVAAEILRGGAEKAREAGVVVVGGHTIQDQEPKYGMIVVGFVQPKEMLSKAGAHPGDKLILSKPLGTGCLTTALKQGIADPLDVAEAIAWMKRLNRGAAELARRFGAHAATDITGFGLLGHAWEMAEASQVGLRFHFAQMPFLRGAKHYAEEWTFPGGSADNRLYYQKHVRFEAALEEHEQMLLFDAQTSGGLLFALPPEKLDALLEAAAQQEQAVWVVGDVVPEEGIVIA